jgi:hypothetical protein
MRRLIFVLGILFSALAARSAEKNFDFSQYPADQTPKDLLPLAAGRGKPGDWKILMEDATPSIAPLTDKAPSVSKRAVLAQLSRDATSTRFPLLICTNETFGDFIFKTRFKLIGGALEQAAGLVFRYQNPTNFFVLIASGASGSLRCTKVVDGQMMPPYHAELEIAKDKWHDLSVQCEGTRITCSLNGSPLLKLVDNSSSGIAGQIGFCTRADAVSYFSDATVTYTPREALAQKLVNSTIAEYSRLVGLKIYAVRPGSKTPVVVASNNLKEIGKTGPAAAADDVIKTGHSYFGKGKETVTVMLPLRDHNGDPMGAVSVEMKTFAGQTEDNALVRAQPILRRMQGQAQTLDELLN